MPDLPFLSDRYYFAGLSVGAATTATFTKDDLYIEPVLVSRPVYLSSLAVNVNVAGNASSVVRLGVYRDVDGVPGELVTDAGTVATNTTGIKTVTFSPEILLDASWYWFVAVSQVGTSPTLVAIQDGITGYMAGFATVAYVMTGVTGALPSTITVDDLVADNPMGPLLYYKVNALIVSIYLADEYDEALTINPILEQPVPGVVPVGTTFEVETAHPIDALVAGLPPDPPPEQIITLTRADEEWDTAFEIEPVSPVRNLVTSGSTADASLYTTTAYAPEADRLLLAWFTSANLTATPNEPTMTGNDCTWEVVDTQVDSINVSRTTLFRCMDAAPSEGGATFDLAGQTQVWGVWSIVEVRGVTTGANGANAIVQSVTSTGDNQATGSVTLAALADTANYAVAGFGLRGYRQILDTGDLFTIGTHGITGLGTIHTEWAVNETFCGAMISAPVTVNAIAVEVDTA